MPTAKLPIGTKVRDSAGAPSLWLRMAGPERTFASDTGDVADQMGATAAGVRSGGCTWADGPRGKCLAFDGVDGGADLSVSLPAGTTEATWSAMVRVADASSNFNGLANFGNASSGTFYPFNDLLYIEILSENRAFEGISHDWDLTAWHRLTVTSAPGDGNYRLYVNGTLKATSTTTGLALPATCQLGVNKSGFHFAGHIDDVRLYPRALSAAEVAREFADPDWRLRARPRTFAASAPPPPAPDPGPGVPTRAKPPIGSKVRHRAGAPTLDLAMLGPERTFASDAGDVADAMGSIPAGERHGGAAWARGQDGPCLAFDGSSGYVQLDEFKLSAGSPITIGYWQYLDAAPSGANSAFNLGAATISGGERCQCHSPYSDGTIYWDFSDAGGGRLTASYAGHYGQWTNVVLQADPIAGYQAIYLDGRLAASRASTSAPMAALAGAYVGAWNLAASYFEGKLSRFRVYPRILTAGEIARDFADPDWRLRPGSRPARNARGAYRPRPRRTQLRIGGHGLA